MSGIKIIQGGMGVGVSGWSLARAVAQCGQLGVISGTALAVLVARRLQQGDPGGHLRRALVHFPVPQISQRVLDQYFNPEGKPRGEPFRLTPMPRLPTDPALTDLTVVANFAEVYLAKEGHHGVVGINYLEKVQLPTLPSLFGAMLAGVDYVLMGAGIPRFIPGILDNLAEGRPAELKVEVEDAGLAEQFHCRFNPVEFCGGNVPALRRPQFLAIVSSATLAMTLARKSNGQVNGFVVEGDTAGGHNAAPRGPAQRNERGEPIYGPRDVADLEKIRALELPFWLAGGFSTPQKLTQALAEGARGMQVGTAFAFCAESNIEPTLKNQVIRLSRAGQADVFTDPAVSPTGYPFKVLQVEGTLSENAAYEQRIRLCDLGYLRQNYRCADGSVGYRCAAEPVEQYLRKGGVQTDTVGRKCLCNALFATVDLGQIFSATDQEQVLLTAGDDVVNLSRLLQPEADSYTAADVIHYLLSN